MDECVLNKTFEMLVERLTNTEIIMSDMKESSKFDILARKSPHTFSGVLFGLSASSTITKHFDVDLERTHYLQVDCPDASAHQDSPKNKDGFWSDRWFDGSETWIDHHVRKFLGDDVYTQTRNRWSEYLSKINGGVPPEDYEELHTTRKDVGLDVEKYETRHEDVTLFWIEIALKASIPELLSWSEIGYMVLDIGKIRKDCPPHKNINVFIMDRISDIVRDVNRLLCPEKFIGHIDMMDIEPYAVNLAIVNSRGYYKNDDIFKKTLGKCSENVLYKLRQKRAHAVHGVGHAYASIYSAT